tara:strand:+ start:186 stop:413 length:228 start_codon:yes stop_codon:yes gene_type:complete
MEERIIHSQFRISKVVLIVMGGVVWEDLIATLWVVSCVIMGIIRLITYIHYLIIMHYVIPLHGLEELSTKVLGVV